MTLRDLLAACCDPQVEPELRAQLRRARLRLELAGGLAESPARADHAVPLARRFGA